MKTTFRESDLHQVKLSTTFSSTHKCKVCKIKFVFGVDKNLKTIKGLIRQKNEYKREKTYVWGIFPCNKELVKKVYLVVNLQVAVCPNCGKEKVMYYSENSEKVYEYGEWQDDDYYFDYYD